MLRFVDVCSLGRYIGLAVLEVSKKSWMTFLELEFRQEQAC